MLCCNVKPGDKLLVTFQGGFNYTKIVKVTRTTPTQIVTDDPDLRYWMRNGKQIGSVEGHIIKGIRT